MTTLENTQSNSSKPLSYDPFELARIGYTVVGNQGLKAFCKKTSLSPSVVSRLLNGSLKSPPRVSTIYKFVAGNEDQAKEMLRACGYPFDSKKMIYDKVNTQFTSTSRFFPCPGLIDFLVFVWEYIVGFPAILYGFFKSFFQNRTTDFTEEINSPIDDNISSQGTLYIHETKSDKDLMVSSWFPFFWGFQYNDIESAKTLRQEYKKKIANTWIARTGVSVPTDDNVFAVGYINDAETLREYISKMLDIENGFSDDFGTTQPLSFSIQSIGKDKSNARHIFIPAFCLNKQSNPNDVVLAAAQTLKIHLLRLKELTQKKAPDNIIDERTKFHIITNSGEVYDIFANTYPNMFLDIELMLINGTHIVEQQEIPSLV